MVVSHALSFPLFPLLRCSACNTSNKQCQHQVSVNTYPLMVSPLRSSSLVETASHDIIVAPGRDVNGSGRIFSSPYPIPYTHKLFIYIGSDVFWIYACWIMIYVTILLYKIVVL